jgi:AraC family transcriptional regulator
MVDEGSPSREAYRERIERCLGFIQEHIKDELRLEDLAAAAAFSKYHFHRVFKVMVGETPADYVKRLRLERAASFLKTRPSLPLSELAEECGFSSPSVFAREFRAAFQMTPSRYRRLGQGASRPSLPPPRPFAVGAGSGAEPRAAAGPSCLLKTLGPYTLAQVLHTGGYGPGIAAAWGRLFAWAGRNGLLNDGPRTAGIAWDNPEVTPAAKCRYSACILVPKGTAGGGAVNILDLPARLYMTMRYRGRESGLSTAYGELYYDGLFPSGFEPDDAPSLEFHAAPPTRERDPYFDIEMAVPVVALR